MSIFNKEILDTLTLLLKAIGVCHCSAWVLSLSDLKHEQASLEYPNISGLDVKMRICKFLSLFHFIHGAVPPTPKHLNLFSALLCTNSRSEEQSSIILVQ